ncbi:MAG: hypothetical protein MHM6MM_000013 [Cercozoa sp. M6MM]
MSHNNSNNSIDTSMASTDDSAIMMDSVPDDAAGIHTGTDDTSDASKGRPQLGPCRYRPMFGPDAYADLPEEDKLFAPDSSFLQMHSPSTGYPIHSSPTAARQAVERARRRLQDESYDYPMASTESSHLEPVREPATLLQSAYGLELRRALFARHAFLRSYCAAPKERQVEIRRRAREGGLGGVDQNDITSSWNALRHFVESGYESDHHASAMAPVSAATRPPDEPDAECHQPHIPPLTEEERSTILYVSNLSLP